MGGQGRRQRGGDKPSEYEGFERRIKAAVEAGKMTREEADAKYKKIRERLGRTVRGENIRGDQRSDIAAIGARIRVDIAAGKITEKQGKERLAGLRKRLAESGRSTRERRTGERDPEAVYNTAEKEIKAAIAAGKITEEQGKARLEGLKKRLAQGGRR